MAQYKDNAPYIGEEKLVIAIDLGTTYSKSNPFNDSLYSESELKLAAVCYLHLCPTCVPEVKTVNFNLDIKLLRRVG